MSTRVELRDLTKRFGTSTVVEDVNLMVNPGEFVSLLGSSGCGKTTILRMVAGLESPTSGAVLFDGQDQTGIVAERRHIAMVFQKALLFPSMTVSDNIGFSLAAAHVSKAEIVERVKEMLEVVQLGGYGQRRVGEISGGQEQRVSLARALIRKPRVLLLDEPLSALDANLREDMRSLIRRIHDEFNLTTIFVTHDQEEATAISDRIAFIDKGLIAQCDEPRAFYSRPSSESVARFFGYLNIFNGSHDGLRFNSPFGFLETDQVANGECTAVIRQEDIEVVNEEGPNRVLARVESAQYLGTRVRLTCVSTTNDGSRIYIDADQTLRPQTGSLVILHLPAARVHVIRESRVS